MGRGIKYSCDILGVLYTLKKLFVKIKLTCHLEEKAVINYNKVLSIIVANFQVLTLTFSISQDRTFWELWYISVPIRPLLSQKPGKPKVVPKFWVIKWVMFWTTSKCGLSGIKWPHINYGLDERAQIGQMIGLMVTEDKYKLWHCILQKGTIKRTSVRKKTSDFSSKYVKRNCSLSCHDILLDSVYIKEEGILWLMRKLSASINR